MFKKLFSVSLVALSVIACQSPEANQNNDELVESPEKEADAVTNEIENDAPRVQEQGGIKIYPKEEIKEFEAASLSMNNEIMVKDDGSIDFDFDVSDYELGAQTTEARMNLANSDKGQHIHLIIDNGPYSAHYEPTFTKTFEDGAHYGIAFLSRSYHESVKNDAAAVTFNFNVNTGEDQAYDMDQPLLFYSRPKGTYRGEGAEKVLFDFYLSNAELASDGYSVIATVNDSLKFEFDDWRPYLIEGLPKGENTIKIQLVDAMGGDVNPRMNETTRKFTIQ